MLLGEGIGLCPLREVVHSDHGVSFPLVPQREVNVYPLEWCHNIVLMHEALTLD
jgi:hypothetical protein